MTVNVLAFGIAKDLLGSSSVKLKLNKNSTKTSEFRKLLITEYPKLSQASSFLLAVNATYANQSTIIHDGDEVAIIPPTNGG